MSQDWVVGYRIRFLLIPILLINGWCLSACQFTAMPERTSVTVRTANAVEIAKQGGLTGRVISTPSFNLMSFQPAAIRGDVLRVYLEGDGHAWEDSRTISSDPTPINPMALRLAVADPSHSAVYLSRPCQYGDASATQKFNQCATQYWSNERYSELVVSAINSAIDQLKRQYQAKKVILIGYSGGGAIAILCAARRNDVEKIVTIAGNVSVRAWVKTMGVDELRGSLDPVDYAQVVQNTPQWHFIGGDDEIVPPSMIESYTSYFPAGAPIKVITLDTFGHQCCWVRQWPLLLDWIQ